jgi:hypothetical protein
MSVFCVFLSLRRLRYSSLDSNHAISNHATNKSKQGRDYRDYRDYRHTAVINNHSGMAACRLTKGKGRKAKAWRLVERCKVNNSQQPTANSQTTVPPTSLPPTPCSSQGTYPFLSHTLTPTHPHTRNRYLFDHSPIIITHHPSSTTRHHPSPQLSACSRQCQQNATPTLTPSPTTTPTPIVPPLNHPLTP